VTQDSAGKLLAHPRNVTSPRPCDVRQIVTFWKGKCFGRNKVT